MSRSSTKEAAPNSSYKAVLQVPHGCDGEATTAIRVQIPEGVIAVKPMPKAGWTLTTTRGTYAKPYENHGRTVNEGVKEIVWSGGSLADEHFDEFTFSAIDRDRRRRGEGRLFPDRAAVREGRGGLDRNSRSRPIVARTEEARARFADFRQHRGRAGRRP